tara:strand:+ start:83417 stop:84829 length:1413 start_codon:yes stop_codon:yes gene_type:complete
MRTRNTKILATLGPASSDESVIESLFLEGVDLFRLNFSHGTTDDHAARVKSIRAIEEKHNRPIGIVADLQGPKFRIGDFRGDQIALKIGQDFRFDLNEDLGDSTRVYLPHPEVVEILEAGQSILLDDGKVRVRITDKGADWLQGTVEAGTKLSNHKGFNVPGVLIPVPALTDKDKQDLKTALELGVDWIAQSFVQTADDAKEAKELIGDRAALMVKLEKPSAIEYLKDIIEVADGAMIARGDLGVEMPPEDVPSLQKQIIRHMREVGKPVVVATQMLESMITNPMPTRAEASDVANAVYDGTDAVMLSAETAAGDYPVETVKIMNRILEKVETDDTYKTIMEATQLATHDNASDAITTAAEQVARDIHAACIVNYTTSGSTALRTARRRPHIPILCLSQNMEVTRRLSVCFGVRGLHITDVNSFFETVQVAVKQAKERNMAKVGETLVLTAGVPFGQVGSTNVLRVAVVE